MAELILDANIHLNVEELVSYYHQVKPKLKYKDICQQHGIPLSLRRLKEIEKETSVTMN